MIASIIALSVTSLYAEHKSGYVRIRSYYGFDQSFQYESLYFSAAVHYVPIERIVMHATISKGAGEKGYYPQGYFHDSRGGIYEKGTYYLYLRDFLRLNKIILGNYSPLFGQGLLFGDIFPLILSNPYYDVSRYRDGLYPKGSTSKHMLLEGVALEYQSGNTYLRPFFSWNRYDCSAGESDYYKYNDNDWDGIPNEEDEDDFSGRTDGFPDNYSSKTDLMSSIRDEPYYDDENGREKRNNLTEYLAGFNVSTERARLKTGFTVTYSRFNRLVDPYYDFDPENGNKTGHSFRGKDLISSSVYFKLYEPVEIFGEAVGTFYKQLSYYEEFNDGFSSAFGLSGGMKKKFERAGIVVWGAYMPAHLINPHGLEYPEGSQNFLSGLFGLNTSGRAVHFNNWVYVYEELFNYADPGNEERGVVYSYRFQAKPGDQTVLKLKQNFSLIENYYYAPLLLSYKVSTKGTLLQPLGGHLYLDLSLENRMGAPFDEELHAGLGFSSELFYRGEAMDFSFLIMTYWTDENRFAYLYPYEKPLYNWSFMPLPLHGYGLSGSMLFLKDIFNSFAAGMKLRYDIDLGDEADHSATLFVLLEYGF
jgi:hypothetical protein